LLWRWLDQQDLRQRRFWGPSYPRRRRCGVSGRSRNAAPATPTPTPTSTTAPTPPPGIGSPTAPHAGADSSTDAGADAGVDSCAEPHAHAHAHAHAHLHAAHGGRAPRAQGAVAAAAAAAPAPSQESFSAMPKMLREIQGEGSWMEMKLHAQYHEWDRKNATIEALVGRGGKHKLRLFTPHDRGLSQTPSRYFMDAFAKFAKRKLNYYQRRMGMVDATVLNFGSQAIRQTSMLLRRSWQCSRSGAFAPRSGYEEATSRRTRKRLRTKQRASCSRSGAFAPRSGYEEATSRRTRKRLRTKERASPFIRRPPGRQAGRQADNHNHLYVYTASGDDDIQPLSVL